MCSRDTRDLADNYEPRLRLIRTVADLPSPEAAIQTSAGPSRRRCALPSAPSTGPGTHPRYGVKAIR
ncbi:hypothetical protein QQS21_004083 [Conoideocrella luteorostrata]|uniref:Uncharacterized protein n=1 Tax=Conoideocrella luteorostrata TaxID=1105319 RepID=A0AAJ0CUW0_9HYPO|nr:hypothetical protein QQS21_004083 [Conoideocrella luteorostrata]